MIAPVAAGFLFIIWLIKKVYQMMITNNERYCYIAYRHNQTGQVFDSGIQLETEIDQTENNIISSGHCILIRYNTKEIEKLKNWVQTFRDHNDIIC
jgi:glutaminase